MTNNKLARGDSPLPARPRRRRRGIRNARASTRESDRCNAERKRHDHGSCRSRGSRRHYRRVIAPLRHASLRHCFSAPSPCLDASSRHASLRHCFVRHCFIASSRHRIITSSHHHIIASSHHHIIASSHHRAIAIDRSQSIRASGPARAPHGRKAASPASRVPGSGAERAAIEQRPARTRDGGSPRAHVIATKMPHFRGHSGSGCASSPAGMQRRVQRLQPACAAILPNGRQCSRTPPPSFGMPRLQARSRPQAYSW